MTLDDTRKRVAALLQARGGLDRLRDLLRPYLGDRSAKLIPNEQTTVNISVVEMLRALGWDGFDEQHLPRVVHQFKALHFQVDIALMHEGLPTVLIEAKGGSVTGKSGRPEQAAVRQLRGYVNRCCLYGLPVSAAVLTNGRDWHVFDVPAGEDRLNLESWTMASVTVPEGWNGIRRRVGRTEMGHVPPRESRLALAEGCDLQDQFCAKYEVHRHPQKTEDSTSYKLHVVRLRGQGEIVCGVMASAGQKAYPALARWLQANGGLGSVRANDVELVPFKCETCGNTYCRCERPCGCA